MNKSAPPRTATACGSSVASVRTTRSTPSAPMPERRSHNAATSAGSRSCRTLPSGSGSSTKSFSVPWPLRKRNLRVVGSATRGVLADPLELREPLLEVGADQLVHALEDAHHLDAEGPRPDHRPGDLGAVALGRERE